MVCRHVTAPSYRASRRMRAGVMAALLLCAAPCVGQTPNPGAAKPVQPAADRIEPTEEQLPAAYFAALAQVKMQYGLYSEAADLFRKAAAHEGKASQKGQYELNLAQALSQSGHVDDALAIWKRLSEGADLSAASWAQLRLATGLAESGRAEEAVPLLEKLALDSPIQILRSTAVRKLGGLLAAREDRDEKVRLYSDRLRKEPGRRELLDLVLTLQEDDPDARLATLAEMLKLKPHDPELMRLYGEELMEADRLDDAEAFYRGVMREYPEATRSACEKLAEIASLKDDPAKAEEWLVAAVRDFPEGVERSLYLARQGNALELWEAAEKSGREAYNLADGAAMKAAAGIELGEALCRLGRAREARALLEPLAEQSAWRGLQTRAKGLLAEMGATPTVKGK